MFPVVHGCFPGGLAGKESARNAGDLGLTPGLGRSPGGGKGYPLQYSGLENSVDFTLHGVSESDTTERLLLLLSNIGILERKGYLHIEGYLKKEFL